MDDPGLFASLYTARALRRFTPDAVPEEVLFQLVDAAIRAPSGQNAQDWRFVVVTDPAVKAKLAEWSQDGWRSYQPEYSADPSAMDALPRRRRLPLKAVAHLIEHLASVPVIVAVCGLRGRHFNPGGSTFTAITNMLLAARGLGLGGSIFNFPLARGDDVRRLLGVPDDYEIASLVVLGYPSDRHGPLSRKPVKRVAFLNRWDEPWPFAESQPDDGWTSRWT